MTHRARDRAPASASRDAGALALDRTQERRLARPEGPAIDRRGRGHRLRCEQWVAAPRDRCFEFFADAANLEALTPSFLRFQILTPLPIAMAIGTLIEYRIALGGVPMTWLTRIEDWQPGRAFTDVQLRGPYARWIHRHTFEAEGGGTRVSDSVDYELPFAPWTDPLHARFVRPRLHRIFAYRRDAITRLLG